MPEPEFLQAEAVGECGSMFHQRWFVGQAGALPPGAACIQPLVGNLLINAAALPPPSARPGQGLLTRLGLCASWGYLVQGSEPLTAP